jgi:MoaA/NifB/PqqE/SkfB family radical SAM enzyme
VAPELKSLGAHLVVVQGAGEPLIHPRITEIAALIKDAGLRLLIITNGLLLDEEKMRAFIAAKVDGLKVTLWASSPEQYLQQYPGSDSANFSAVLGRLRRLAALKKELGSALPQICLHHPINTNNFTTLDKFTELALEAGCDSLSFSPFSSVWQELARFALTGSQEKEAVRRLTAIRKKLRAKKFPHNIDQVLLRYRWGQHVWKKIPCYIGWFHARIRSDGAVLSCGRSELTFGDLNEKSFSEVWNDAPLRRFRARAMRCEILAGLAKSCDCDYCCFVVDNYRIHRVFKWFAPFAPRSGRREAGCGNS